MSWNTALYEYKNTRFDEKTDKDGLDIYESIKEVVMKHLEKENAIAVLQEMPYKSNVDWKLHPIFLKFKKDIENYACIYNVSNKGQIMMTVVVAHKNIIQKNKKGINSNRYVSFLVNNTDLSIMGVHARSAAELGNDLKENRSTYCPNILMGDFNSGNYRKLVGDNAIANNRKDYLAVTEGYIDACQGMRTTRYNTYIDHILLEYSYEFLSKHKYFDSYVDESIKLSDHFPLYCTIRDDNAKTN